MKKNYLFSFFIVTLLTQNCFATTIPGSKLTQLYISPVLTDGTFGEPQLTAGSLSQLNGLLDSGATVGADFSVNADQSGNVSVDYVFSFIQSGDVVFQQPGVMVGPGGKAPVSGGGASKTVSATAKLNYINLTVATDQHTAGEVISLGGTNGSINGFTIKITGSNIEILSQSVSKISSSTIMGKGETLTSLTIGFEFGSQASTFSNLSKQVSGINASLSQGNSVVLSMMLNSDNSLTFNAKTSKGGPVENFPLGNQALSPSPKSGAKKTGQSIGYKTSNSASAIMYNITGTNHTFKYEDKKTVLAPKTPTTLQATLQAVTNKSTASDVATAIKSYYNAQTPPVTITQALWTGTIQPALTSAKITAASAVQSALNIASPTQPKHQATVGGSTSHRRRRS